MLKNFFLVAYRNILRNKVYSGINIGGLAIGMAVALLIGLWIRDELSFNKSHRNYSRIAGVYQHVKFTDDKSTYNVMPIPMAAELRDKYPDFKYVSLSQHFNNSLAVGTKKLSKTGDFVQPDFPQMVSAEMKSGSIQALKDMNSMLISTSLAKTFFGDEDPLNQLIKINNKMTAKVAGVYEDFPLNSEFKDVFYMASWDLYVASEDWVKNSSTDWDSNNFRIYVQLKPGADFANVSAKIKDIRMKLENPPPYKPEFFLEPMSQWHLYGDYKNGVSIGGLIQFVWLFGTIGIFVLLLACINFMNLSTARSERRAREVGIRKAIGSMRRQLIVQFFSESLLVTLIAFVISILLVQLALPTFNEITGKQMQVPWLNGLFWLMALGFCLITGMIAGSYPSLYLSSFQPIKVLKGTFRAGRFAAMPRRILVVLQFTVSVILIIGTVIVLRQVQFAKDRPVGYDRSRLIEMNMATLEFSKHYDAIRADLIRTGAITNLSQSSGTVTEQSGGTTDISWKGKSPDMHPLLMSNSVTHDYGETIGWQMKLGRDFSREFMLDTASMLLNESAVKLMGFAKPIGETVKHGRRNYQVVGVVKDMVRESPFRPVSPTFFMLNYNNVSVMNMKLSEELSTGTALGRIESVLKKYDPNSPFDYSFVDKTYGQKFSSMELIGKLASYFAVLAIFISCLGLFGMASFVAEQRTREIGVRKVLGATVFNVWRLLSKEFIFLVLTSFVIAAPIAWYFMHDWLQGYEYRIQLSWWIFAAAGGAAMTITILTVSFQAIRAALANPVRSLRTE